MNIQAKVAIDKARHPERYCPERRCLWRTGGDYCPRHEDVLVPTERLQEIYDAGSAMQEARDAAGRRPPRARLVGKLAKPLVGVLTEHPEPQKHQPPMMKAPDEEEWHPLLVGVKGGRS
jgi:hypothetical protein